MKSVSVVIPVKDGERYLGELLDALASEHVEQTLVIDSGSRDRSREIVQANVWNEKPVSLTPDQLTLLQALDGRTTVTALVADLASGGRDADAVIEDVRRLCERGVLDLV